MDKLIEDLKSTTFSGKRFTRKQIAAIQDTVTTFTKLSRRELAHTICVHLNWYTPKGDNKIQSCLRALESMEKLGILTLPAKIEAKKRGSQKKITWTNQTAAQPAIDDALKQLTPVNLQVVTDKDAIDQWNEAVDRHHYLGYKRPIGAHLRYFILDKQGRKLGCLLFSYAVKSLPCRDEWIGWQDKTYKKHMNLVVNNNRFLIFPWVNVKHLASKVLAIAARQLAADWQERHGYRPVLLETFVDTTKFKATSYRAANWQHLGETKGLAATKNKAGKPKKAVYVYPLVPAAQSILLHGPRTSLQTRQRTSSAPQPLTTADPFVQLWQNIIGTLTAVANDFDAQWQKRKRFLNTLLILLFIFRLVFSKNKPGYAITLAELWEQCRTMGIPLPQATPVTPAAICNARAKLDENVFKTLQVQILKHADRPGKGSQWKQHRLFAVDGTKMNLPRALIDNGYRTPSDNAWYPQGLVSCLYQLKSKIPLDFDLVAHADERKVARTHLTALSANDVVVYDRGYFSYVMLYEHKVRSLHAVFRMQTNTSSVIDAFTASDETDQIVEMIPSQDNASRIHRKYPQVDCKPIWLRLVKYTVARTTYILGTTLLDQQKYKIRDLSDVYHARWGVEELYKISKQLIKVEEFHGQSERGVKQELFAHFVLITLTRIFSNHCENSFNSHNTVDETPKSKANFKNCLLTVARNIEGLLLQQATVVSKTINNILESIYLCRQKERPGRSFDRISRKPAGKWKPGKSARLARTKVTC